MKNPCVGMVLFGKIIPDTGGDTQFANQEYAYQSLPFVLKDRIDSLSIKHNASYASNGNIAHQQWQKPTGLREQSDGR